MAATSLSRRTLEGFAWMAAGAGGQAILRIAILAVLARLLSPTEFGVIGAAMTVIALADILGTVGLAPAVVQMPGLGERHLRIAFTISVLLGAVIAAAASLNAPLIAGLFRIPAMESPIQILSIIFVVRGFAIVAEAKLQRDMRFRSLSLIGLVSYLVGYGFVAVTLALAGYGLWALVSGQIVQICCASLGHCLCARHSMRPLLDRAVIRRLFGFGTGVTLANLGNYVALNLDQFIVGRWLGATSLGLYNRAYAILMQPVNLLGAVGDKVLFPALASIQSDRQRMARAYSRSFSLIAISTIPLSLFLLIFSEEIVWVLLGSRWQNIVLPFQILLATMFFRTAYKISSTLLRALGLTYRLALWQWLYAASVGAGALLGSHAGIAGVSIGVGAAILLTFLLGIGFCQQACDLDLRGLTASLVRCLLLAVIINAPLYLLKQLLLPVALHPLWMLAAGCAGALTIGGLVWSLARPLLGPEADWLRASLRRDRT